MSTSVFYTGSFAAMSVAHEYIAVVCSCRLWEDGWKDRYYESKFAVGQEDLEFRNKVVSHCCYKL